MLNDTDKSTVILRLEEVYALADKSLSDAKQRMILDDIQELEFYGILGRIKNIKQAIINGAKFDTAMVYRMFGIRKDEKNAKPKGCSKCDDGYIMAIQNEREYAFACDCDLGKYRRKGERLKAYWKQELTENFSFRTEDIALTPKEKEVIFNEVKYLANAELFQD